MKKILLLVTICVLTGLGYQSSAQQICGSGAIRHWTGAGDAGDMGPGPAGSTVAGHTFTIDGNSVPDWDYWISGAFNYAGSPKLQYEPNPYLNTLSPANVQQDGLIDSTGTNYDRDAVGQTHRDLRYFAFTYDQANVYFFFRRPANNTAQVTLYYFIDINVDGWMATGEPVIQLTFNNSGSSILMGYYEAALPNGYPASAFDAIKGNSMTATTTRAKTNNTSEWSIGVADGWSMPGNFKVFPNGVSVPALGQVAGINELFTSATLTDTHSDGTDAGYGVEFAVPWKYFAKYDVASKTFGTPLTSGSIFTWHVSLVGGQSGISGAQDNAGGCCAGLGVSGSPQVNKSATWVSTANNAYDFRLNITYTNQKNYPTIITTGNIKIIDPRDANDQPIPENVVKNWTFTGYKNADCVIGNETTADSVHFEWTNTDAGTKTYTFTAYTITKARVTAANTIGSTACYYINVYALGWPPLKSADLEYSYTTEFDISSTTCDDIQSGTASGSLEVLPVKFLSFNAVRNGSNVNLTWQTATEEGNAGFEVQKFMGSGDWQTITFVPTQAVNGYSNTTLNYTLTDLNTSRGVTQYRLKQIDKNNKSAYSVIRSVRGEGQKGKTIVYPNPSSDGKVNIIFEDVKGIRDVSVTDMSGRMIKQMKGVTNNNIQIDNLNAGMYTVRVLNVETGEQVVEKFVVNKR